MRKTILIFLILTTTFLISQTKRTTIKVTIEVDPVFNKVTVKLKKDLDSLNNCKVQIIDSKKHTVKIADLPNGWQQLESSVAIQDLIPGQYTCIVYQGKVELYKKDFFKDAIFMEPQSQPVIRNNEK